MVRVELIRVEITFVTGKVVTTLVDNREQAMQTLRSIEKGEIFVGWPDSPTPVLINPTHVMFASVQS